MSQNPLILKILIQTVFAKTGARRGTGPRPTIPKMPPKSVARGPVPREAADTPMPWGKMARDRPSPYDTENASGYVARGPVPREAADTPMP